MYIRSIELRDYHQCHRLEILRSVPPNKILVRVFPPFPSHLYSSVMAEIDQVVLAPRYLGDVLPPTDLSRPTIVNICIARDSNSSLVEGPWSILDIGEILDRPTS
jgi:hypothetical protein